MHRHIMYCWQVLFVTSMNLISLPQNEALFSLDPLTKFVTFARKSVSMIQALSSGTEGTIVMKRSRETCWILETVVDVTGDCNAILGSRGLATGVARAATTTSCLPRSWLPTKWCHLKLLLWNVFDGGSLVVEIVRLPYGVKEKETARSEERERA